MNRHTAASAAFALAVLGLSACATADVGIKSTVQAEYGDRCNYPVGSTPGTAGPMKQYVATTPGTGPTTEEILKTANNDPAPLRKVLDDLGGQGTTLRDKIKSIKDGNTTNGFGGISARFFLRAAEQSLNNRGQFRTVLNVVTTGQLTAFHYVPGGESCLEVLMTKTITARSGRAFTVRYKWTVFADLSRAVRDDSNPDDVFSTPDTVKITKAMADKHNFQFKLWAKGTDIQVTRVERAFNTSSNFFLLPKNNRFYKVTPDACIDMMFQFDPPETMPSDAEPPFYCLGRCDEPPIINTK